MAAFFPNLVLVDEANDRPNPGVRYHGIDPGVPISGSPSRFAFASPRFGVAYDVFGDAQDGSSRRLGSLPLERSGERLPGHARNLTDAADLQPAWRKERDAQRDRELAGACFGLATPGAINGQIYATDPNDYNVPVTYSYNFTISRELPWRSLFEIAYVGSDTHDILLGGQNGSGNITTLPAASSIATKCRWARCTIRCRDPLDPVTECRPQTRKIRQDLQRFRCMQPVRGLPSVRQRVRDERHHRAGARSGMQTTMRCR